MHGEFSPVAHKANIIDGEQVAVSQRIKRIENLGNRTVKIFASKFVGAPSRKADTPAMRHGVAALREAT